MSINIGGGYNLWGIYNSCMIQEQEIYQNSQKVNCQIQTLCNHEKKNDKTYEVDLHIDIEISLIINVTNLTL